VTTAFFLFHSSVFEGLAPVDLTATNKHKLIKIPVIFSALLINVNSKDNLELSSQVFVNPEPLSLCYCTSSNTQTTEVTCVSTI